MARLVVPLALLTLLVPLGAGAAVPLKTARSGAISIKVPATWKVVRRSGAVALVATARRPEAGYHANVTVVSGVPRGRSSMQAWRRTTVAGLRPATSGATLTSRIVRLPAGRAVEISVRSRRARATRWLLYAVDAGPKAYIVTLTAGARAWTRYGDLFRSLARTLRIRR